jgi:hypothetical protein
MPKHRRVTAPVLKLVPKISEGHNCLGDSRSEACVRELRNLLNQAVSGELIGVAFVAMYGDRQGGYIVDTVGEAYSCPTYARGCVQALDDILKDKVYGK